MPTPIEIAAAFAALQSDVEKQQADDSAAILTLQQSRDNAQAALAVVTAERDKLKAQLAALTHVDPPAPATVDLTPAINLGNSLQLGHEHAYTVRAGDTVAKASGMKILGDKANPILVTVVKGNAAGGSGIYVQATDVEIAGIQWAGPNLAVRASSKASRLHLHDCIAPPCDIDPKATPGLNALLVIEYGAEGVIVENIGTPTNPLCTVGAGLFCFANNCTVTNWYGCSWNEQSIRFTTFEDADKKRYPRPVGIAWNNVNVWSVTTKGGADIREGEGTITGGKYPANLGLGQGAGTDNTKIKITGATFCYSGGPGALNSMLDAKFGTVLDIDNCVFDLTGSPTIQADGHTKALIQPISCGGNCTINIGPNVVRKALPGVTVKELVSSPAATPTQPATTKVTGVASAIVAVPAGVPAAAQPAK